MFLLGLSLGVSVKRMNSTPYTGRPRFAYNLNCFIIQIGIYKILVHLNRKYMFFRSALNYKNMMFRDIHLWYTVQKTSPRLLA